MRDFGQCSAVLVCAAGSNGITALHACMLPHTTATYLTWVVRATATLSNASMHLPSLMCMGYSLLPPPAHMPNTVPSNRQGVAAVCCHGCCCHVPALQVTRSLPRHTYSNRV